MFYLLWTIFWLIQLTKASVLLAPAYFSDPSFPFWNQSIVGYPLIPFCWQAAWCLVQSTSAILAKFLDLKFTLWISFLKCFSDFNPDWSQMFAMSAPWSKEFNQNEIKFFKSLFQIIVIQMINTIDDFISLLGAFSDWDLFTFDNNDVTCILSECEDS